MSTNYHPVLAVGLLKSEITREDLDDLIYHETVQTFQEGDGDDNPVVGFALYKGYQTIEDNGLIVYNIQKLKDQFYKIFQQEAELHLCLDWY